MLLVLALVVLTLTLNLRNELEASRWSWRYLRLGPLRPVMLRSRYIFVAGLTDLVADISGRAISLIFGCDFEGLEDHDGPLDQVKVKEKERGNQTR